MKRIAAIAAITLLPATAHAEEDGQLWLAPIVQTPIVGKLRSWIELQARARDDGGQVDRLIARPAVSYGLGKGFAVWAGYGYMPFTKPATGSELYPEHRPWQQVNHVGGDPALGQLQNRLRFEQRFIEALDPSFRVRYMARLVHRPKSWGGFGYALWDEIFVNLNTVQGGPRAGFDQNRFAIGLQYAVSKQLVFEPSYLLVSQWRANREPLHGHTGLLFVWITL